MKTAKLYVGISDVSLDLLKHIDRHIIDILSMGIKIDIEKIVEKDFVVERTTGKLRSSLEAMTEEEFTRFADLRSIKRDTFKVLSKNCQEKRCYVTYSLGYRQAPEGKTTWHSEVKKIAEVQWIEGKWLIADVSNLKTYHESVETIEVSP